MPPRLQAPREAQIRAALETWLARRLGPETVLVHELAIKHGKFRVDLCGITDKLHGYEIKSDQDTLSRLPAQAKQFSLVFHRMTLVVGPALLASALAMVPEWWGVLLVTRDEAGETCFSELREARPNPKHNYRWVVRLLWRDEQTACLKAAGVRGYSKLKYWQVANKMLEVFTPEELTAHVCRVLRGRKGQLPPPELFEAPEDGWEPTDYSVWDDQHLA